jgi:Cu/Ag efflux protein CusF
MKFWIEGAMRMSIAVLFAATPAAPSWAQTQSSDHAAHHPEQSAAQPLADGEVRKVDKEAGKLTLKHGPIANLDMPEMTMVFRVKDPAILDRVKVGDKVKFAADKVNGVLTVTNLEVITQ